MYYYIWFWFAGQQTTKKAAEATLFEIRYGWEYTVCTCTFDVLSQPVLPFGFSSFPLRQTESTSMTAFFRGRRSNSS